MTFLTPTVFRAAIPLPADVPTGNYDDRRQAVRRRRDGRAHQFGAGSDQGRLRAIVADAARDHGLLYGLATTLMALLTGWIASVVFRRD